MYTEERTIDHILATYTANVREASVRALISSGYLGVDPRVSNDVPHSLSGLRRYLQRTRATKFPVNVVGSDKTVFTDPTVNLLFRAWHDLGHLTLNAEFDYEGERRVATWQAQFLEGIDKEILMSDVVDQYDYYVQTGKFVDDQRSFVIDKVFGAYGKLPPAQPEFVGFPEERLYA